MTDEVIFPRVEEKGISTAENAILSMMIDGYDPEERFTDAARMALSRVATAVISAATVALLFAPQKADGAVVALQADTTPRLAISTGGQFSGWIDVPTAPLVRGDLETVRFSGGPNTGPVFFTSSLPITSVPSGCDPLQKPPVRQILCHPGGTHSAGIQIKPDERKTSAEFVMTTEIGGHQYRVTLKQPILDHDNGRGRTMYLPLILRHR